MTDQDSLRTGILVVRLCALLIVGMFLSATQVPKLATVYTPLELRQGKKPLVHRSSTFKVLTYNIWNFNDGAHWDSRKLDIVQTILRSEADFVGLNEVRRHEDKSGDDMFEDLAELLSDHGYSGAYQPAMRYPSQGVEEGVAFFTKLHVLRSDIEARHLHHDRDDVSDSNRRVCLSVRLKLGDVSVRMFVTHFSYSVHDQIDNAKGVVEFINELNTSNALLMGDFNVLAQEKASQEAVDILEEYPLVDTWLTTCKARGGTQECNGYTFCNCKIGSTCELNERIDRIYTSPLIAQTLDRFDIVGEARDAVHSECPSDHRAAFAVFALPFESRHWNTTSVYMEG